MIKSEQVNKVCFLNVPREVRSRKENREKQWSRGYLAVMSKNCPVNQFRQQPLNLYVCIQFVTKCGKSWTTCIYSCYYVCSCNHHHNLLSLSPLTFTFLPKLAFVITLLPHGIICLFSVILKFSVTHKGVSAKPPEAADRLAGGDSDFKLHASVLMMF